MPALASLLGDGQAAALAELRARLSRHETTKAKRPDRRAARRPHNRDHRRKITDDT